MDNKADIMEVNCGTCKHLDVPPEDLTKHGVVKKIREFRGYRCVVVFDRPITPIWYPLPPVIDMNWTYPLNGKNCLMHEPRK